MMTPTLIQSPTKVWSQEEFHQLPEGPPYFELQNGELLEMPRPTVKHQRIIAKLNYVITHHLEKMGIGEVLPEVEVDITPTITYVPDLTFLTNDKLNLYKDDVAIDGVPDLAVEVLSSSTQVHDWSEKYDNYQKAGVHWYWIVSQELMIWEFQNVDGYFRRLQVAGHGDVFKPKLFPELSINLAQLMGETVKENDE